LTDLREALAYSLFVRVVRVVRLKLWLESLIKRLTNGRRSPQKENPDRIERSGFWLSVFSFSRPA
jgi:hypothetical protein